MTRNNTIFSDALPVGISRRGFLLTGTAVLLGGAVAHALPVSAGTRRRTPQTFFPDVPLDETLRHLALVAVEAARATGADFADVRVGIERSIAVPPPHLPPTVTLQVGYGVRVLVDGTWSFQHGSILTPEAIAAVSRDAVTGAKAYAEVNAGLDAASGVELVSTPVVTGEWRTPIEIDPLTVPLDDYYRAFLPLTDLSADIYRNTNVQSVALGWTAETRVFASTAGSLVTQHFMRGGPAFSGQAVLPENRFDRVLIDVPGLEPRSCGFEIVLHTDWVDRMLSGIEEAIRLRELPRTQFQDIGRFPIVFEGGAFADLIGTSLSAALDGDRAFGLEADAAGGTFLSPPQDILTAQSPLFSPHLTVTSDRALPSLTAVGWDDEGVVPVPATLVESGQVVNYHTTRETAPMLLSWYDQRGQPRRAQGRSIATHAGTLPVCGAGHVTVKPAESAGGTAEWMREMKHGFVVRRANVWMEPNVSAGRAAGQDVVLEVRNGKAVARTNIHMQFALKALLGEKLQAVGTQPTMRTVSVNSQKGMPWQHVMQQITAPSAFCKDVDVFSWNISR